MRAGLLAVLALTMAATPATADEVLFARDGALWKVPAGGGEAVKVVEMDRSARGIERIEVGGDSVLVRAGRARRWVKGERVGGLGCGAEPEAGKGMGKGMGTRELGWDGQSVRCAVDQDTDVIVDAKGKRWTERVERVGMVGPAGRAVAVADGALVTFKVGGTKARRVLLRDAVPVSWSANGQWLLIGLGESACIIRAVGGQYKCWTGYLPLAIAGDGSQAVLGKPGATRTDLYRGQLAGARAEAPALLVRDVDGPAAWLDGAGPAGADVSPPELEEGGPE